MAGAPAGSPAIVSAPAATPESSGKTVALPGARPPKVTFVRGGAGGADGIPCVWELTIAGDPAVAPPAPRPCSGRRAARVARSSGAALAAAAAATAFALRRDHRAAPVADALAEVSVESTPAGARVFWDGREVAAPSPTIHADRAAPRADEQVTNLELRFARLPRVGEEGDRARPRGAQRLLSRSARGAPASRLVVTTDPPGAEVAVDGRTVGRTPLGNVTLAADGRKHALHLRRHGYADVTEEIELGDGQDVVVDRKLAATPRFGTIDLHVDPWALIYLDGRKIGEAPVKGLSLPLGHHVLKLVNPVRHKHVLLAVDVPAKHAYRVKLP